MLEQNESRNYFEGNEWRLPTDINVVGLAADEVRRRLEEARLGETDIQDIEIVFRELFINAIVHGNLGIKDKSEDESWREAALRKQANNKTNKSVYVKFDINSDRVAFTIRDEGEGFDWRQQASPDTNEDALKTSGKGVRYFLALMDSIKYNEAGNEVIAIKERDRVAELLLKLEIDLEKINPNILRKLKLLHKKTKTFADEERSVHMAQALFRYYETNLSDKKFTGQERKTVLVGTMFTDIGKTGPRNATSEQEEIILDIYGIENIENSEKTTLMQFLEKHFSKDALKRLTTIETIEKVNGDMTMREFYNLHSAWTLEIISGDGVPPEAIAAAATHHALEGVNPEEIIGKDGRFTKYFGENISFSRDDKLIIILDKYVAARRRGKMTHEKAIEFVHKKIKSNEQFVDDEEFETLLNNLDAMVLADEKVYES